MLRRLLVSRRDRALSADADARARLARVDAYCLRHPSAAWLAIDVRREVRASAVRLRRWDTALDIFTLNGRR